VRRVFLASAVEWAMDLHYEVREVTRVKEGDPVRWRVSGRAWDGDRPFDDQQLSDPYPLGDRRAESWRPRNPRPGLLRAIGGLIGWSTLVPEPAARPKPLAVGDRAVAPHELPDEQVVAGHVLRLGGAIPALAHRDSGRLPGVDGPASAVRRALLGR
jgi:hypothetical protein